MDVLFETPWILVALGLTIAAIALFRVMPRTAKGGIAGVAGGLLLTALGPYVDAVVVTPREQVDANLTQLVTDFAANDLQAVTDQFDPNMPMLKALAAAGVTFVDLEEGYRLTDIQTDVDGSTATQHFRLNGEVSVGRRGSVGHQPSRWELTWSQQGTNSLWVITDVQELDVITGERKNRVEKYLGINR